MTGSRHHDPRPAILGDGVPKAGSALGVVDLRWIDHVLPEAESGVSASEQQEESREEGEMMVGY